MQHTTYNVRQARATCIAFASSQASRYEHMLWLLEHMQAHTNEGATSGAMPYAHMELPQPDVCSFATAIDALIKDERIDEVKTCHICAGTGPTAATSAPGLGRPLPHLHQDWADRCRIMTSTWHTGCDRVRAHAA
jgi:hypothetical protein